MIYNSRMSGIIYQVIGALILDYNCLVYGMAAAIPSTTMILFTSEHTTLNRPMTQTEGSLMASLASIGGFVCTPIMGYLMDIIGRKKCTIIAALFCVLSWTMMAFSSKVEVILTAIFMLGFAGSMFLVIPVYISELAQASIRGTLASGVVVFYGIGMLFMFIMSEFLDHKSITYIGLTASTIAVALLTILEESPTLLLKRGFEDEATIAMGFYRNAKPDSKLVTQEIENIRRSLEPEHEEMTPEKQKLTAEFGKQPAEKLTKWQFFKKSRSTQRALILTLTIMSAAIFQGMITLQMYAIPLFRDAVPEEVLSPNWCSALLSCVSVAVGLIAGYMTDVAGRRYMLITSCIAAGFCSLALGTQVHLHWGPQWVTALFIYLFCVTYTFGSGTVPFLLMAEMFLPDVKSVMSMICVEWNWLCTFLSLFLFSPLVTALGLGPLLYFFTCVAFVTAVFAYFFLPETKGLTVDAIQLALVKKKGEL